VEIEWDADDRNLMPDPIVLEYAPSKTAAVWTSIAEKIPNSRRYVWEVADKTLYKFFVRIRAVDKASNTNEHVYEKEVIIDLDNPSATIEHVKGSGAPVTAERPPAPAPDPPPVSPEKPAPAPVKPAPPLNLPTPPGKAQDPLLPVPGGK